MTGRLQRREGFTLTEMLVSLAILSMIALLVATQIQFTDKTYRTTNAKIEQFRAARIAFNTITRNLTQATLNSYLDLVDRNGYPPTSTSYNGTPDHDQRQSELRFYCGPSTGIGTLANSPTHAIFFCAPLGSTQSGGDQGLEQLLNLCGYYIQYASDATINNVPSFFPATAAQRYRFRLMEMLVPSENVDVYNYTVGATQPYTAQTWFTNYLSGAIPGYTHVLADNIVALIIMPKLSSEQEQELNYNDGWVTKNTYLYDSSSSIPRNLSSGTPYQGNQLPPVLQITLVAIDEASAIRYQAQSGSPATMPTLVPASAFTTVTNYQSDLNSVTQNLQTLNLNYRVFTSNISITGARWSMDKGD